MHEWPFSKGVLCMIVPRIATRPGSSAVNSRYCFRPGACRSADQPSCSLTHTRSLGMQVFYGRVRILVIGRYSMAIAYTENIKKQAHIHTINILVHFSAQPSYWRGGGGGLGNYSLVHFC